MAWSDVQLNQMVSFDDASSSGIALLPGQEHSYFGKCMSRADILAKYDVNTDLINEYTTNNNQLVPKQYWSYVGFTSWYTASGTSGTSTSGTVTIVGQHLEFKAFATIFTGSGATCTVNINIGGNYRTAIITGIGTNYSSGFILAPGTYSYSVSCTITSGGVYSGGITYSLIE